MSIRLLPRIGSSPLGRTCFSSSTPLRRFATSPPPPPTSHPSASSSSRSRQEQYTSHHRAHYSQRNRSLLLYSTATIILVTTASYLAVPLYRVFCSQTGYGGTPQTDRSRFGPERLIPVREEEAGRRIKVQFNADKSDSLPWSFTPQQREVRVLPGETALAFYTATNHSEEDIIGIATYNVTPNNVRPSARLGSAFTLLRRSLTPTPCARNNRSHPTSPKSNAFVSKNNAS